MATKASRRGPLLFTETYTVMLYREEERAGVPAEVINYEHEVMAHNTAQEDPCSYCPFWQVGCTRNYGNDKEPHQSPNGHTVKWHSCGTQVSGLPKREFKMTLIT